MYVINKGAILFLKIIICVLIFACSSAGAATEEERASVVRQIHKYMDDLEHMQADFRQYSGKSFSSGKVTINYPKSIIVDYLEPKRVTVTYNSQTPETIKYYDHNLKQEKIVKAHVALIDLLMEKNFAAAVTINDVEISAAEVTMHANYKNENFLVIFNKNPLSIKSMSTVVSSNGKKVRVTVELLNHNMLTG